MQIQFDNSQKLKQSDHHCDKHQSPPSFPLLMFTPQPNIVRNLTILQLSNVKVVSILGFLKRVLIDDQKFKLEVQ